MADKSFSTNSLTVENIMVHPVFTVHPQMKLWEVSELFIAKGISGAPVVDNTDHVMSVIGEGIALRMAAKYGLESTVAHCLSDMTPAKDLITLRIDESFATAYKIFLKYKIHRIPIVDDTKKLLGLVTRSQILRLFVEAHHGKSIPKK
ncbi:MAG: CBS domain-containing protein [Bdellovibrionales bacterium]|nr:CBS domain-containing protein [Bdellovibrionales bacterium]